MSILSQYLERKLSPLREKVTVNKRAYDGQLHIQRKKYTNEQISDIVKRGSEPSKDTLYDRQRKQYLADKFGVYRLQVEGMPKEETVCTVADAALGNVARANENFKQYRGIIDTGESLTAFAVSVKL